MAPGAFICGLSAAAIYQYPADDPGDRDVGVFAPQRAPRGKGVRGRKVEPHLAFVRTWHGLPITTPASTWAMLGRELSERKLVILADAILQVPRDKYGTQHPEQRGATREQLQAALDAGRRVGLPRLRSALARARVGSSSPLETEYRLDAEDAGLPTPELDVEIRDARGRRVGISEIVYRDYRIIVEIEGDHHRTSRWQWNRDIQKYRDYADAGWEVVRITSMDIRTTRRAVDIVRMALVRRGWNPTA
ncbi:hypothetical protein [Microbacterium alcoholitolerans]|uniref:hypothetical protein n=1 Tax=unclassified Microbacterium TaxID=2609290 RepID=UPI003D163751